ncbi:hypothetical protein AGLY_006476 [Aphis glycines]|uniref:Uncharacterized protein n=1 Tax=Aphis glycines TaxID=307491 RepID=A0A6G0TRC7_APHGL|nr:hypothetical protein AGLY_006476 [Aphis glycines]
MLMSVVSFKFLRNLSKTRKFAILKIWYKVLHKFFFKYLVDKIFWPNQNTCKLYTKFLIYYSYTFEVQILTKIRQNHEYLQIILLTNHLRSELFFRNISSNKFNDKTHITLIFLFSGTNKRIEKAIYNILYIWDLNFQYTSISLFATHLLGTAIYHVTILQLYGTTINSIYTKDKRQPRHLPHLLTKITPNKKDFTIQRLIDLIIMKTTRNNSNYKLYLNQIHQNRDTQNKNLELKITAKIISDIAK